MTPALNRRKPEREIFSDAPRITLDLGSKLNAENIVENSDVYLDCAVDAFPAADDVHWTFDGKDLAAGQNVIISKNFLIIQQVRKSIDFCPTSTSLCLSGNVPQYSPELDPELSTARVYS